MAGYILIGVLAAFGGVSVLWTLFGWLLPGSSGGVLVYPGRPGEGELSFARRYLWLRGLGLLKCPMIVVDLGLTVREKEWLETRGIEIRSPEAFAAGLEIGAEEIDGTGNGDPPGRHQRCGVSEL